MCCFSENSEKYFDLTLFKYKYVLLKEVAEASVDKPKHGSAEPSAEASADASAESEASVGHYPC